MFEYADQFVFTQISIINLEINRVDFDTITLLQTSNYVEFYNCLIGFLNYNIAFRHNLNSLFNLVCI